jgi:hypothetical protein
MSRVFYLKIERFFGDRCEEKAKPGNRLTIHGIYLPDAFWIEKSSRLKQ